MGPKKPNTNLQPNQKSMQVLNILYNSNNFSELEIETKKLINQSLFMAVIFLNQKKFLKTLLKYPIN